MLIAVAYFILVSFIAPWVDQRRKRVRADRDFARAHRVDAPRFDRPARPCTDRDGRRDPSPRRLGDYEARAIAEGMEQT